MKLKLCCVTRFHKQIRFLVLNKQGACDKCGGLDSNAMGTGQVSVFALALVVGLAVVL